MAAELGQAHRHVAVVEDDRDAEALAQQRSGCRAGGSSGTVKTTTASTSRSRSSRSARGAGASAASPSARSPRGPSGRCRRGRARHAGGSGRPSTRATRSRTRRERLALAVAGVRRSPPPRRLDRPAAVRRDDQVAAGLVQALPELPPRRRAAVAEVEVDRGRDREDLRGLHAPSSIASGARRIVAPMRYRNGNGVSRLRLAERAHPREHRGALLVRQAGRCS